MLDTDAATTKALLLPRTYAITSEPKQGLSMFLHAQEKKFKSGVKLLQFRAKSLNRERYKRYAVALIQLAHSYEAKVMLNTDVDFALSISADGVHLTARRLMALETRPRHNGFWVAASCHDEASLRHADALSLDFVVLSPVKKTLSHVAAVPMGWRRFEDLLDGVNLPVFALGGMSLDDLDVAVRAGAQGIAGIRVFS